MTNPPEKSEGAFRTIREVADWLGVPTHVLRFWESKFDQIAPVKGAGGRRYYRPEDMQLLGGIKVMLHDQGLTIRAVSQKIEDEGVDPVMALSPELEVPEGPPQRTRRVIRHGEDGETARVISFDTAKSGAPPATATGASERVPDMADRPEPEAVAPAESSPAPVTPRPAPESSDDPEEVKAPEHAPLADDIPTAAEEDTQEPEETAPEEGAALEDSLPTEASAAPPAEPEPDQATATPGALPAPETPENILDPVRRAIALARRADRIAPADRMRLRRLFRRYRALIDEIHDDLSRSPRR